MTETTFDLADIVERTRALARRVRDALSASARADVRALAVDIAVPLDETLISVVVVGAYDAGKSTLVSALTGRTDIAIGSDVSTTAVTSYRWRGVDLFDTPGIHAGRPDHDALTYDAIERGDLLLFVISNELFDHQLSTHFRDLVLKGSRAAHTMLVINKMSQDAGTAADKLPDVARTTAPLAPDDLRAVFIDARCALDSRTADEPDRTELVELAGWSEFVGALNRFVRDRGHFGRLAHPVHALTSVVAAAQSRLAADNDGPDRMRLELLHRKESILVDLERRMRADISALVDKGCGEIITMGDCLAESIEADADAKSLEGLANDTAACAAARIDTLVREADSLTRRAIEDLDRQIAALAETPLARVLDARAKVEASFGSAPDVTTPTAAWNEAGGYAKTAKTVATRVMGLARGPGKAASEASSAAAAGSHLHKSVRTIGGFFGHKFRPWQAVKIAKGIGNVARVVGVVAGVLGPLLQYLDERHSDNVARDLREARSSIRAAYRGAASEVAAQFQSSTEAGIAAVITPELENVREEHHEIVHARDDRSAEARGLAELHLVCRELLKRVAALA